MVATRHGLRGAAVADVGYLITQELTTENGRRLVSCKYINAGRWCYNARGCGADDHSWSCGGGGSPRFPCAGRWAARIPNEKQLPHEENQAGRGAVAVGDPLGGWWYAQLEGGKG